MLEPERAHVAEIARRLGDEGLVIGTSGNVSVRSGELVAVTSTGAVLRDLEPEQVAVVDLHGRQRDGELAPTSELELHLGIYRRFDAGAVVHTHARYATAISCVVDELPVVHYGLLELGGPIRVVPYATYGTPELAASVAAGLEGRGAVLMSNHGTVTVGPDLDAALERTRVLEWGSEIYWRACALGEPRVLDAAQQAAFFDAFRDYGLTKRRETTDR